MRSLVAVLAILIILPARAAQPCAPVRIMPIGDSIALGTGTEPKTGYRLPLYRRLLLAGYAVDFVGSQSMADEATAPAYFDPDHEGHGGWRGEEIAANIYGWLVANPADIVLLMAGTNDLSRGQPPTTEDIEATLDEVDRFNPATWVIVAQIPNRAIYSSETTEYNLNLSLLVRQRIATGDRLRLVDMENALLYPDDIYDPQTSGVHLTPGGYHKMALEWYEALAPLLTDCAETIPPANNVFLPFVEVMNIGN